MAAQLKVATQQARSSMEAQAGQAELLVGEYLEVSAEEILWSLGMVMSRHARLLSILALRPLLLSLTMFVTGMLC